MPITPATWKAEAGELQAQGQPNNLSETLSQNKKQKELGM